MRPGPQFTHERMANTLRQQSSLSEEVRRFAGTGDLIPWAAPMEGSVSDPACFSGLSGHYIRYNDLVYVTFSVAFAGAGTGSGNYILPLPVEPWPSSNGPRGRWRATQGGSEIDGNIMMSSGQATLTYRTSAGVAVPANVSSTQPFGWVAGATIDGYLLYLPTTGV